MTIEQLLQRAQDDLSARLTARETMPEWQRLQQIRDLCRTENRDPADNEVAEVRAALAATAVVTSQITQLRSRVVDLEQERANDAATAALLAETHPVGSRVGADAAVRAVDGSTAVVHERHPFVRANDGRPAALAPEQRFADHPVVREWAASRASADAAVAGQHGSLGQLIRSMTTTSGSAIVPTTWASDIIDRARNFAAVLQAGAQIVPMDSKVVQIGRLTADPTAAFRTEGSTITASDPTFDNVTLTATTMSALVVGSIEWFQDANNVDEIVSNAIAKAIGLQLDLVGLYGSITAGAGTINLPTPPNPRGVLGALNAVATSSVLGAAANGTAQTAASFWNEILDLLYTPQDFNEKPNALIWNSKLGRKYAKSYDTMGQPLRRPADVDALDIYTSNQIPSYTQGTMTNVATDAFVGDWSQLIIGQRMELHVQTLTERYAENGQVGIVANWRGDIQPARPRAFAAYKAIQGS